MDIPTVGESWKIPGSQVSYILVYADSAAAFEHVLVYADSAARFEHILVYTDGDAANAASPYAESSAGLQNSKNRGIPRNGRDLSALVIAWHRCSPVWHAVVSVDACEGHVRTAYDEDEAEDE